LGHRDTPSIDVSDEIAILAARPIASLRWRGIGPATAGTAACRSVSKSSIAVALTEAADASFATDQPSRARAERHWAAEIIALRNVFQQGLPRRRL
jgi:hypothetical protein